MKHLLFVMMLLCGACTHAQEGWNVSQKKKGYGMEKRSVIIWRAVVFGEPSIL